MNSSRFNCSNRIFKTLRFGLQKTSNISANDYEIIVARNQDYDKGISAPHVIVSWCRLIEIATTSPISYSWHLLLHSYHHFH